ncbi:hypothetical protein SporoP37_07805 [Sporosarcina sp. P37]|nr:hypothetical protein SporoP37_07805 [Sporosarcina sp. P37]
MLERSYPLSIRSYGLLALIHSVQAINHLAQALIPAVQAINHLAQALIHAAQAINHTAQLLIHISRPILNSRSHKLNPQENNTSQTQNKSGIITAVKTPKDCTMER